VCASHCSGQGGINRPRSKTFEEYEKDTNDIWNDGGGLDFNEAELEFVAEEGGEEPGGKKRGVAGSAGPKGKAKGGCCSSLSVIHTEAADSSGLNRYLPSCTVSYDEVAATYSV